MSINIQSINPIEDRCQECSGYLSVAPVMILGNKPICGRCFSKYPNAPGVRATEYEEIAKLVVFPCQNDIHGCEMTFNWSSAYDHEISCEYRVLWCPAVGCDERIRIMDVAEHFSRFHKELKMEQRILTIPIMEIGEVFAINRYFENKNKFFILKLRVCDDDAFINISCLNDFETLFYIHISGQNNCEKLFHNVLKYSEKYDVNDEYMEIDHYQHVQAGSCITFAIQGDDFNMSFNRELLSELECPICFYYIRPPFLGCEAGHIVCSECREKMNPCICPICRRFPIDFQINEWDEIAEKLLYPCKYEEFGCDFVQEPNGFNGHEIRCPFKTIPCCLDNCDWNGQIFSLAKHLSSVHYDVFVHVGKPIKIYLSELRNKVLYSECEQDIFKISVEYRKTEGLKLLVRLLSSLGNCISYRYFLEFTNGSYHLVTQKNDIVNEINVLPLEIPSKQIKPFLDRNVLTFTIQIYKLE